MKKPIITTVAIFSIAIVIAVWIGGRYINKTWGHTKTVSVVGKAERNFTSDLIVWKFSYNVLNISMKDGYTELKNANQIVRDYLKSKGLSENETTFFAIESDKETEYHWDNSSQQSYYTFKGYNLTQTVRIESHDVDKIEQISRGISELLDKGIELSNNELSYYYTKLSDLKIEMLAEATENARNRAETIAKSAGAKLGGLQTANMGVFQITAPNSADEDYSWGGTFNTSSKQKCATINMRLTYNVK